MISLIEILKEVLKSPKAIILAGAPGSGKGFILKGLDLGSLKMLNIDKHFIDLLKQSEISLDFKSHSAEDRSKTAKAMARSQVPFRSEQDNIINNKESFILDGTASSFRNTEKLKIRLEEVGYEVFMLYVYANLERSLKQNQERFEKSGGEDRSLPPSIVLRTWGSVTQNYNPYKELFGNNFVSVANTLENEEIKDLESLTKQYLEPFKPQNLKPKDAKAQIRADKAKIQSTQQIKSLLNNKVVQNIINNSVSKEEAQSKIKQFLT